MLDNAGLTEDIRVAVRDGVAEAVFTAGKDSAGIGENTFGQMPDLSLSGISSLAEGFLAIPEAKLATVLVLLATAGFFAYRFYNSLRDAAKDVDAANVDPAAAEGVAKAAFGQARWAEMGNAVWSGVGEAGTRAAELASDLVGAVSSAAQAGVRRARINIRGLVQRFGRIFRR